ncbi:hypothetical protein DOTSEDRAFT_75987 [Dothistroma septosporum NZE10]|uniref:Uncharacterized protein n=1 Tax=Dothistroma septosporum (strain NZE10 / CBS 128990) TaxID=675120 RepID=M2YI13_DOTSN|nr:hypothetical protein DOTSEDRAFT_75987 [Dothistroma septosporum NZE10]
MSVHRSWIGLFLTWTFAAFCTATPGQRDYKQNAFCQAVDQVVADFRDEGPATAFCSSYLHLSTACTDTTVTHYSTISTDILTTVTKTQTSTVISTSTAQPLTVISSSSVSETIVTSTSGASVTGTTTVTASVSTSTSTTIITSTSTVTPHTTVTSALTRCTQPAANPPGKRAFRRGNAPQKPPCFGGYKDPNIISSACSCLSIPHATSRRTVTVSKTTTASHVVTSTVHVTQTSSATTVVTSPSTQTTLVIVPSTSTVIIPSDVESTVSIVMTTVTTTTSMTTTTSFAPTSTATRYTNFALMASNAGFGVIHNNGASSASGIYFTDATLAGASGFSLSGQSLLHNNVRMVSFQQNSGNYFSVTNMGNIGFNTNCQLGATSGVCEMTCQCDGAGLFPVASGNDVENNNGNWGWQGSLADSKFIVYAVGQ